jgi:outer membrane lipoprotein SlyB
MAALNGTTAGAALGGLAGALIGMGIPEYEAKRYEGKIKEGNVLISVEAQVNERSHAAVGRRTV